MSWRRLTDDELQVLKFQNLSGYGNEDVGLMAEELLELRHPDPDIQHLANEIHEAHERLGVFPAWQVETLVAAIRSRA